MWTLESPAVASHPLRRSAKRETGARSVYSLPQFSNSRAFESEASTAVRLTTAQERFRA